MQRHMAYVGSINLRPLLGFCLGASLALVVALSALLWYDIQIIQQQAAVVEVQQATITEQQSQINKQETMLQEHQTRLQTVITWRESCKRVIAVADYETFACPVQGDTALK